MNASRIMIIGSGGAGKSTLSRQIQKITGLPLIHLDQYFWHTNWKETDKKVWVEKVRKLAQQEAWIMDGNYGGTMDIRLKRAEMIIFLNLSRWTCLWGIIKRVIRFYGKTRPDMAGGCPERFSWEFLRYVWNYKTSRGPGILAKLAQLPADKDIFIFKNRAEVRSFLRLLKQKF
jgi:adenylate kinase family enzyme